jgi:CubicO group peptidase (beta-lactamase class C family)
MRFLLLLCLFQSAHAQDIAAKADEFLNSYTIQDKFSGSVLIAKGGNVVLEKGYGMANYELNVPCKPETKFRLGSITKQFTATCIMQLQEKGLLSTGDLISKYVENTPDAWKDITIHHLLTHTSGLPNFTADIALFSDRRRPLTPMQLIEKMREKPMRFKPGEKYEYCNTGYIILTAVIEKVSGQSYADYLQSHILDVVGMKDTGSDNHRMVLPNRASGYSMGTNGLRNSDFIDMSIPAGAGCLYSTVLDMYKWDRALYTEKLLTRGSLDKMFTAEKNNYGYGWLIVDRNGHKMITHDGGIDGFVSHIARFPQDDDCLIILCNRETDISAIERGLASILFGEKYDLPKARKEIPLSTDILDRYVGEYEASPTMVFTIRRAGDHLTAQLTGQDALRIHASSEQEFFLTEVDATITFELDAAGDPTTLVLHQSGREVKAHRPPRL